MGRNGWSEWVREGECLIRSLRSSGVSGCPSEFSFMAAFFASAGDTLLLLLLLMLLLLLQATR